MYIGSFFPKKGFSYVGIESVMVEKWLPNNSNFGFKCGERIMDFFGGTN